MSSFFKDIARTSYKISRAANDASAVQRGTYGKRVVRRQATKSVWGPIMRGLFR